VVLPFVIPWIDDIPGPLPGWWFAWNMRVLAFGGVTEIDTPQGAAYFQDASIFMAIAFWAVSGFLYALVTRRLRLRYVILGAYPAMFLLLYIVTATIHALGYQQQQWSP
jgi:hypothetical protein